MTERIITDSDGTDWRVTSIRPSIVHYQVSAGWLSFRSPDGRHFRARRELFSGDWRRLTPTALRRLLATAQSVERAD